MLGIAPRRRRADHRAVGDERLPEGSARPHALGDLARRGERRRAAPRSPTGGATASEARRNPQVIGAAPFVAVAGADRARRRHARRRSCAASSPSEEATVTDLAAKLKDTTLARLVPGAWGVVLGVELARSLGVRDGDKVTIVLPGGQVTPAGVVPRLKHAHRRRHLRRRPLRVRQRPGAGRSSTMPRKLFRVDGPTGVQLRLKDLEPGAAGRRRARSSLGPQRRRARLDPHQPQLVLRGAGREAPDVHHPDADRRGRRVQPGLDAGDDGDRQARRHRDPAHARRDAALGDGHLHGPGRGLGRDRHARRRRCSAWSSPSTSTSSCRRSSALLHVSFLPSSVYLISRMPSDPQQGDIVPIALDLAGARVPRDALSELAREPAAAGRGAAL